MIRRVMLAIGDALFSVVFGLALLVDRVFDRFERKHNED